MVNTNGNGVSDNLTEELRAFGVEALERYLDDASFRETEEGARITETLESCGIDATGDGRLRRTIDELRDEEPKT